MDDALLQAFGYLASAIVAVSLMMRSIVRLRWINLAGAVCFSAYGILIRAYPVAAVNFAIIIINIYFLAGIRRAKGAFTLLELPPDSPYLAAFLRFYAPDIARARPGFALDPAARPHVLLVLRDMEPAGAFVLHPGPGRDAVLALDFVTPAYRDLRVGEHLFRERRDLLAGLGIDRIRASATGAEQAVALERLGFTRTPLGWELDVAPG